MLVQEEIVKKVNKSGMWTIMADETTDMANREQMVLVVRYVDATDDGFVIREDPIALMDVMTTLRQSSDATEIKLSGANLAKVLVGKVENLRLDMSKLVGQCYDGAASMSSEKVGVAACVKEKAPLADYFHCAVHAVNLSTSLIRKVAVVRNGLDAMEAAITFLTDGAKRGDLIQAMRKEALGDACQQKLVKLCHTRFVERHLAVQRFCEQLPAINRALEAMATWDDSRSSSKATLVLNTISKTEFLVGVFIAERLAGILKPLAASLQEQGADLMKALDLIDAVKHVIKEQRQSSEEQFTSVMERVESAAQELHVELKKPRLVSRSAHRGNTGDDDDSVTEYYRLNAFIPALDYVLQDLELRFGKHVNLVAGLGVLIPRRLARSGAEWKLLQPAHAKLQQLLEGVTESQLEAELRVWEAMWKSRPEAPGTAIGALNECPVTVFPGIHALLRVLAVLPVSTAEAERTFSKVTRTLTALRASMREERLEALVLIQTHRDLLPDYGKVVDRFAAAGSRRLNFLLRL
ncbi:52 kDa repressor of the inhibitor of the protein kinase-like [Amphibalanus amphitrite]|uniref:52 kDa repressor of the inhibitor of the protein kinase-like n=1 Tax=Amphibalanus amphitrite TaxID=1232801 RepID=UPI001C910079|nr:52 kDa repressor of the inhibitor of the protein kinase-like [Amphibalanus amphitrite]